jgi:hypothetical protein
LQAHAHKAEMQAFKIAQLEAHVVSAEALRLQAPPSSWQQTAAAVGGAAAKVVGGAAAKVGEVLVGSGSGESTKKRKLSSPSPE